MSIRRVLNSPYLTTKTGLWDTLCTFSFFYLMWASVAAIVTSHSLAARIDIFSFLIPHATKVILWSFTAILWLRPRFGWRYPFAMFMLYCSAELLTNWIWYLSHITQLTITTLFIFSEVFFVLGVTLSYLFLKGHFRWRLDWAMLPFIFFVGSWVAMGYQTESTIPYPSYWLEAQEFIWNVLYLLMVTQIFRATRPAIEMDAIPFAKGVRPST